LANQIFFQASLVVRLLDDFTGEPVPGNKARVFIAGQKPPIVKDGGYYIFVNLHEKQVRLTCKGSVYQERTQEIDLARDGEDEAVVIRLLPAAQYPVPSAATCVTGRTYPGSKLLFWGGEKSGYRLLSDCHAADNTVAIYAPRASALVGRAFFLCDKEGTQKQIIKILGEKKQQYQTDTELMFDYKKAETAAIPVYEVTADENGEFFLMLSKEQENSGEIFYRTEGEEERRLLLQTGAVNTVIL